MERENKIEIAKMILAVVAVAGILSVVLIAPNAMLMFGIFRNKKVKAVNFRFNRALKDLEDKGLVKISRSMVKITEKGKKELAFYEFKRKIVKIPKKWDKKWRIVSFDIWERRRSVRDSIRRCLNQLGFARLQNSVWVFPYECREIVDLLKINFKVRPAVLYIVADSVENDEKLKSKFGLK